VAWRLSTLAIMVPAVPTALERSTRPWLNALLLVLVALESAVLLATIIRRRRYYTPGWPLLDGAVALMCLLAQPWYVPDNDLVGTWVGWAPAFAASAVMSVATGSPRRRAIFLMTSAIAASYLVVSLPAVGHGAELATVLSNTLTYGVFGILCRTMASVARRFGTDADEARNTAVEATRRLEVERSRRLLHDPASLLRYLADPDLDPQLAETVRAQALTEANRIRAYLTDQHTPGGRRHDGQARLLSDAIQAGTASFTDLPIELLIQLADGVEVAAGSAEAVAAATATVLHNVRRHAGPDTSVVVHADYEPDDHEWELTIRDNGRGFDPACTPRGYGLSQVAGQALAEQCITSHVHSVPDVGTTITIRGRAV
jgi:signal transduction histidine kinase